MDPYFKNAYNNLGLCQYKLKLYPQAYATFKKAIELDPYYPEAINNLQICVNKMLNPLISNVDPNLTNKLLVK